MWLSPWIEDNFLDLKSDNNETQVLMAQQLLGQIEAKALELGHIADDAEKGTTAGPSHRRSVAQEGQVPDAAGRGAVPAPGHVQGRLRS